MKVDAIKFLTVKYVGEYEGDVTEHFDVVLDLSALSKPYILKKATGLDPDELISRFYATTTVVNEEYFPYQRFYNLIPEARVVTLKIGLNPNYSEGETNNSLRDRIYKMIAFHRGGLITMEFLDNDYVNPYDDSTVKAVLNGFITHVESDMFSETADITITVTCPDPYLRSLYVTSNTDMLQDDIEIEGDPSTAPHGFNAFFEFTSASEDGFLIRSVKDSDVANLTITYEFAAGDRLYMGTDPMNRYIYVDKYPDYEFEDRVYLMDKVVPGSIWPVLFPETNHLQVTVGEVTVESIDYFEAYWGI